MDHGSIDMRKVTRKDRVNGYEAANALAMLGIVVLNVVHVMHK